MKRDTQRASQTTEKDERTRQNKKNRYNCPLGLEYLRTPCTFSHFAGGGDGLCDSQQLIMFITPRFGVLFINKN